MRNAPRPSIPPLPEPTFFAKLKKAIRENHATKESWWLLLGGNLFFIALAIYEHWPAQNVIFLFWSQNIVIGVFACLRVLAWKNIVSDAKVVVLGSPVSGKAEKLSVAVIFGIAFFGLHALLLHTFAGFADMASVDMWETFWAIRLALGLFLFAQAASFIADYRRDSAKPTGYSDIFGNTFMLVVPLFLWMACFAPLFILSQFVLLGAYFAGVNEGILGVISTALGLWWPAIALVLFMVPKALLDALAHLANHTKMPAAPKP